MAVATDPPIAYEGKAKILSEGPSPETLTVTFKDEATAFNGEKFAQIPGKGKLNATISKLLFEYLNQAGITTCYQRAGELETQLIYSKLTMIPLEVVVRNVAYGSVSNRYQLTDGTPFTQPVIEYFWKKDAANDPLITHDMIREFKLIPEQTTLSTLEQTALAINECLLARFTPANITCADFKLELGIDAQGKLVLGDELSPDNFRLRDTSTGQILDKDVFRLETGDLIETYTEVLHRLKATDAKALQNETVYKATVLVSSRKNILNPQSKAVTQAVQTNGYPNVKEIKAGKQYTLTLTAKNQIEATTTANQLAQQILSNPVIEDAIVSRVVRQSVKG